MIAKLLHQYSPYILMGLIWLIGWLFDQARINKAKWEYPAHLSVEITLIYIWWLTGQNWGWFLIAANVGWFFMGLSQKIFDKKGKERPLLWFGNGKGNTPELICRVFNKWLFHRPTITVASLWFRAGTLATAATLLWII